MKTLDLAGKRFGRLLVLEKCGHIGKYIAWKCKCDCGNETVVAVNNLQNGSTKSCGCLARELSSARRKIHGLTNTTLHKTWKNIRQKSKTCGLINSNLGHSKTKIEDLFKTENE